jgi:hypothetical protein
MFIDDSSGLASGRTVEESVVLSPVFIEISVSRGVDVLGVFADVALVLSSVTYKY